MKEGTQNLLGFFHPPFPSPVFVIHLTDHLTQAAENSIDVTTEFLASSLKLLLIELVQELKWAHGECYHYVDCTYTALEEIVDFFESEEGCEVPLSNEQKLRFRRDNLVDVKGMDPLLAALRKADKTLMAVTSLRTILEEKLQGRAGDGNRVEEIRVAEPENPLGGLLKDILPRLLHEISIRTSSCADLLLGNIDYKKECSPGYRLHTEDPFNKLGRENGFPRPNVTSLLNRLRKELRTLESEILRVARLSNQINILILNLGRQTEESLRIALQEAGNVFALPARAEH